MAYIRRIVQAGPVRETRKFMNGRIHTKGAKRAPRHLATPADQIKINERVAEERLRWKINANFGKGDLHVVLHYYRKTMTLDEAADCLALFRRRLKDACRKAGIPCRYIVCTETKRMTNIHHHMILNSMDPDIVAAAWESVAGGGHISFTKLDGRGNHGDLANYLIKETRSTVDRYKEAGRKTRRFSPSQHLEMPEPRYEVVQASQWREEPKAKKGCVLFKFDDGETLRRGWHEKTGYEWQEYFEIDYGKADQKNGLQHTGGKGKERGISSKASRHKRPNKKPEEPPAAV
ncbi:hypothetical protein QVN85_10280 [Oscillibacter valericigenes]|nr:hypothetical protein [Oscillibacter valericigenes]